MDPLINLIANLGVPLALIVVALITGTMIERRHYRSIHRREQALEGVLL